jgi:hypothetical protein
LVAKAKMLMPGQPGNGDSQNPISILERHTTEQWSCSCQYFPHISITTSIPHLPDIPYQTSNLFCTIRHQIHNCISRVVINVIKMAIVRNSSSEYDGPMPKEMIANHILAREIINRHNDACPIFDDRSILVLREFVQDPTKAQAILERLKLNDTAEQEPGTQANLSGSLVGYIIAVHGTEKAALTDDEVVALREWYESGGGRTDDEVAKGS